jgi:hypothetical protein
MAAHSCRFCSRLFMLWLCVPVVAFGSGWRPALEIEPVVQPPELGYKPAAATALQDTLWIADWTFDAPGGGCTETGWMHYDNRIRNDGSNYWTVNSAFAGSGGILGNAAVLRKHDLGWARDGYGNDWDYSIVLKYRGTGSTLSFRFLSDSEPGYDFFTVEADSLGLSASRVDYRVNPSGTPTGFRQVLVTYTGPQSSGTVSGLVLPDFGVPAATHEVSLRFASDSGNSDQDGGYPSAWHAGLIVDNVIVTGSLAYTENFEAALNSNITLANTAPATPFGDWTRLWQHPTDNNLCTENSTCAWIFSDPTLPAYFPDMAFGLGGFVVRNWLDDILVSPWVALPAVSGPAPTILSIRRFGGNRFDRGDIIQGWRVRSKVRIDNTDTPAPGDSLDALTAWAHLTYNSLSSFTWSTSLWDMSTYMPAGAREIQVSFRTTDAQLVGGAAPPATLNPGPGPYLDRVRIGRRSITGPNVYSVPSEGTAADGFPSVRNTIAPGENFSPTSNRFGTVDFAAAMISLGQGGHVWDIATYNTADSIVIDARDTRLAGALWVGIYGAIVSGPHVGKAPPPLSVGTNGFFVVDADSAKGSSGGWVTNRWYADLDDEYFRPGDVMVYFWAATDAAGGFTSSPPGLTGLPASVAQAQEATGGLYEFHALPMTDWDPAYLARVAAHPTGKIDPTPAEIANSRQRSSILYVWQRPWARQSGAAHRTAFMHSLDQLGYQNLYDQFFIPKNWATYLGHLAARASVEQATGYSLIIQDALNETWNVLPPPDYRERPVPQVQWYRDWLARAPASEARRATLWLLGDQFVASEGDNPLVQADMGVAVAHAPQTLSPYPEISGQRAFTWASGDSTDFAGDQLVLARGTCSYRANTGLAATGTAVVTHRYTLGASIGDGAVVMNANPAASWNTILGSFSWEDLLEMPGSPPGDRQAEWLDKILTGVLPDSVRARAHPTDVLDHTIALPRATFLHQNTPNPFNPVTTIRFDLARSDQVLLRVYDAAGRQVRTLLDASLPAGWNHRVTWNGLDENGRRVASGVYFYRLSAGDFSCTRKLVVLK